MKRIEEKGNNRRGGGHSLITSSVSDLFEMRRRSQTACEESRRQSSRTSEGNDVPSTEYHYMYQDSELEF